MAKTSSNHQLFRSDQRLLGLGLFSVALLLGVFSLLNPGILQTVKSGEFRAERTIKVEEFPSNLGQFQNAESSYAAEDATNSGSMNSHSPVNSGY